MSDNKWWSTKVGLKLLSDFIIFSIFSSDNPLDFHESIRVVPLKYLMYFLTGINTICDGVVLKIYLDHKFHWPQENLNCESLAYEVVT